MKQNKLILGYRNIRGREDVLRSLLAFCKVSYVNHLYTGSAQWHDKDKHELGFSFPNPPYIIEREEKITETLALMHYIVHKGNKKEL